MQKYPINLTSGLVTSARQLVSPFCDARPQGELPELIVIHAISLPPDTYGGGFVDDLFCGCLDPQAHAYFAEIAHLRVSSHLFINRAGAVTQYVPLHCRAWHAGVSRYQGRTGCNDFSIGIELEGCDRDTFTNAQYTSLNELILSLCHSYTSLSWKRIAGHSDIAPGRKTDPGPGFDWNRLTAKPYAQEAL
ncbi:MAG: 1,6-anhydro-N-acetylmuramyl-L-alanine amidase AmpD [Gammaproteobacteria bacterium]|nr:1,6-anhydro-N-acetylmuramyl-L-alanine amidase AmpD [Gammaproteobacteria bacterium]NNC97151.1 1,6-anhydro-N-acetylmuramyl-L-alanine amidase AmpD [Gammaproteobacteria bacterium]NNM13719.1 1,6-anhydro-N-acetylmuramyl-L-alanine amidase AmpD [Gammaproteobacteria bacterium]